MKVGRNDPCPCGSRKKYKKCCLREARSAAAPREADGGSAELRHSAYQALERFAERAEFGRAHAAALELFNGGPPRVPGTDEDSVGDLYLKFCFYFYFDHLLEDGRTLLEAFLQRAAWQVTSRQQQRLRRLGAARLRPYEVEEVQVDQGLRLCDLWSEKQIFVTERKATHELTRWDVLALRVAPDEDGTLRLEGGPYMYPTRLKGALLDALKAEERRLRRQEPELDEDAFFKHCARLFHHFWLDHVVFQPMPTLVTTEGDPLVLGKVVFDVLDRPALEAALEGHAELGPDEDGGYSWIEEADDGLIRNLGRIVIEDERLVLEVMSRQRAERGRRLLEDAAPGALRHRATRHESMDQAMRRHRAEPRREEEEADAVPPEIAAQILGDYKDRHYKTWPDHPLPALDGRTPREAARLKTMRPRLIDLLKEMENMETRRARPDNPPYDFGSIWTELGLERPK